MQIRTRITHSDVSEAFREYIERRLRFGLDRFADRVGAISVCIKADGPGGYQCRMSAQILPSGEVTTSENDFDLLTAISRAAGKMSHQIGRELERMKNGRVKRDSIRLAA